MEAYKKILVQIREAEKKFHRPQGSVQLLAVTKGRSLESIQQAFVEGQHAFGENYVQEALQKIRLLSALNVEWHFIGNLQTNKTRPVAEFFSWVHSVSSFRIAQRLSQQRPTYLPPINICIEVNISNEMTKSGVPMVAVEDLAAEIQNLPNLKLRGLMVIPEFTNDFQKQRDIYHHVFLLQQKLNAAGLNLDTLSMGMSHDFIAAIAEGSTWVRIGRALFT